MLRMYSMYLLIYKDGKENSEIVHKCSRLKRQMMDFVVPSIALMFQRYQGIFVK